MRIAGILADILSETIVIIVTIRKTFHLRNTLNLVDSKKPGLGRLLLIDGSVFMSLINSNYVRLSSFQGTIYFFVSRSCNSDPSLLYSGFGFQPSALLILLLAHMLVLIVSLLDSS